MVCSGHVLWLFLIIMWYFYIEGCVNDWSTGDLTRGKEVTDRDRYREKEKKMSDGKGRELAEMFLPKCVGGEDRGVCSVLEKISDDWFGERDGQENEGMGYQGNGIRCFMRFRRVETRKERD